MRQGFIVVGCVAICLALAVPAAASEPGWTLRVFAAGFDPSLSETVINDDGDDIGVSADSALGFGASIEYRFTDLVGVEFGGMWGSPDVTLHAEIPDYGELSVKDSLSTDVLTLDLNLHLTPSSPYFDVFVGAGLAFVQYGSLHFEVLDVDVLDVTVGDDTTFSAKAGVGIALGKKSDWSAFGSLRSIWSEIEASESGDPSSAAESLDNNIFSFSVGIGYRF